MYGKRGGNRAAPFYLGAAASARIDRVATAVRARGTIVYRTNSEVLIYYSFSVAVFLQSLGGYQCVHHSSDSFFYYHF